VVNGSNIKLTLYVISRDVQINLGEGDREQNSRTLSAVTYQQTINNSIANEDSFILNVNSELCRRKLTLQCIVTLLHGWNMIQ